MTGDEIRSAFLGFFEEKGHTVIPSSSLIPHGDPTLLLTTAGMVQFKPYFLGLEVPPNPRLASCQKCFRTTDIESVGDSKHLTFFEMLGNFSIGDYFKEEAIEWAWQFVTGRLGLPPERLWITIFRDDDESFGIWRQIGVPASRIMRFGEEENFWGPAGDSGPCGPCSELHYDFGEGTGCGKPDCGPGCDCGRFSEIWNLVFTQYNQDEAGNRMLLPKPNIDTGMGLERVAAVMQGKTTVYDADLFASLVARVSELAGKKYGRDDDTDRAMRIVAEHSRGIAFLIADGVMPDNYGRGYVLRRLLRRAALFGRRLGRDKPFFAEIMPVVIERMKHIYPELESRRDYTLRVTELEEARFEETLGTGLEILDGIMAEVSAKGKSIPGKQAFRLYDTYGFPVEMTAEIAAGRGFSVDLAGFESEMAAQRERARASHKFGTAQYEGFDVVLDVEETPFVGYNCLKQKSAVVALIAGGKPVSSVSSGQEAGVVLGTTPFYAETGGQVGDTGEITGSAGRFVVEDTIRIPPDIIVHRGRVAEGSFNVGDEVEAVVDAARRLDIARNHTATHLLQYALRQVLGEHVQQRGSVVAPDRLRFDFSHLTAMTKDEIANVQRLVNEKVRANLPVSAAELPYKEAISAGAIALFDEKYGDVVRTLSIGEPVVSLELCGGTHVGATGEIGFFHIISEGSIGSGLRRIEAVTGRAGEAFVAKRLADLARIAKSVDAELDDVVSKTGELGAELKKERRRRRELERELARGIAESLLDRAEMVSGVRVLAAQVPPARMDTLREMSDLIRERLGSVVLVLGTVYEGRPQFLAAVTPDLVEQGYHAGDIIKQVAGLTGGGGGGKASLAQAGGRDRDKLGEALRLVKKLI